MLIVFLMYSLFLFCPLLPGCISVFLFICAVYGQFVLVSGVCVCGLDQALIDCEEESGAIIEVFCVTHQVTLL